MTDGPAADALPSQWWVPDESHLGIVTRELESELSPGHTLFGVGAVVVGRCGACDEVLARLQPDRFAMVHLTWTGKAETPPWPRSTETGDYAATLSALAKHGEDLHD